MENKEIIDLRDRIITRSRTVPYALISIHSGISVSWLTKFARGRIKNPRIDTVSRLKSALDKIANV